MGEEDGVVKDPTWKWLGDVVTVTEGEARTSLHVKNILRVALRQHSLSPGRWLVICYQGGAWYTAEFADRQQAGQLHFEIARHMAGADT